MADRRRDAPDFEAMTLDEITEWNVAKKAELNALHEEYRSSNDVYKAKVQEWHIQEATKQLMIAADASGRTIEEQAHYWLEEENALDPGHRIQAELYLYGEQRSDH